MASIVLAPYTSATFTVPASSGIAVFSPTTYVVQTQATFANYPTPVPQVVFNSSGYYTPSVYTVPTIVTIQAGGSPLYYNTGTAPVVIENQGNFTTVPVATLNATGTLTLALLSAGVVTSTTAAAVTATLETGAIMDAKAQFVVGDTIVWSAINTGATNAFTVTASAGHTVVGSGTVALSTSARFQTTKTAANTWVTYRLS